MPEFTDDQLRYFICDAIGWPGDAMARELLRLREELASAKRAVKVEGDWIEELQAERDALRDELMNILGPDATGMVVEKQEWVDLRAKYDRLKEACIFRYCDSERGYLERCKVCLSEWLDGELHKHDGWCPLAEEATDG